MLRGNHSPVVDEYAACRIPVAVLVDEEHHGIVVLTVEIFLIRHVAVMTLYQQEIVYEIDADYVAVIPVAV